MRRAVANYAKQGWGGDGGNSIDDTSKVVLRETAGGGKFLRLCCLCYTFE